ncbi:MAG: alternative oxidase [Patescibacteria group bacterium]
MSSTHEELVAKLRDGEALRAYMADCDGYRPGLLARMLGGMLVGIGSLLYGTKPSYEKFKAIEVIARIPYQSWEAVAYTLLTLFYSDEHRAIKLSKVLPFARHAQDNETMHVVVVSQLVKQRGHNGFIRHTLIPLVFSFFYYWLVWCISMFERKVAFEVNYIFEQHAFDQYTEFMRENQALLEGRRVTSDFLKFYGRSVQNEYELFDTIRIDEAIHRNCSLEMVRELEHGRMM